MTGGGADPQRCSGPQFSPLPVRRFLRIQVLLVIYSISHLSRHRLGSRTGEPTQHVVLPADTRLLAELPSTTRAFWVSQSRVPPTCRISGDVHLCAERGVHVCIAQPENDFNTLWPYFLKGSSRYNGVHCLPKTLLVRSRSLLRLAR